MKVIAASILVLLLGSPVFARDLDIVGCTADKQRATLTVDVNDAANCSTVTEIIMAFIKTAKALNADVLVSEEGFRTFVGNLSEAAHDAIDSINKSPVIDGSCR